MKFLVVFFSGFTLGGLVMTRELVVARLRELVDEVYDAR